MIIYFALEVEVGRGPGIQKNFQNDYFQVDPHNSKFMHLVSIKQIVLDALARFLQAGGCCC